MWVEEKYTSCIFDISAFEFDIYVDDVAVFHSQLNFRETEQKKGDKQMKEKKCLALTTFIVGFMRRFYCDSLVATDQQTAFLALPLTPYSSTWTTNWICCLLAWGCF